MYKRQIPTTEDLPEGQGKVRMSWEAGLAVDHFEIMETGATEATSRVISSTEAAAGEAWVENLKSFTEYTITTVSYTHLVTLSNNVWVTLSLLQPVVLDSMVA